MRVRVEDLEQNCDMTSINVKNCGDFSVIALMAVLLAVTEFRASAESGKFTLKSRSDWVSFPTQSNKFWDTVVVSTVKSGRRMEESDEVRVEDAILRFCLASTDEGVSTMTRRVHVVYFWFAYILFQLSNSGKY